MYSRGKGDCLKPYKESRLLKSNKLIMKKVKPIIALTLLFASLFTSNANAGCEACVDATDTVQICCKGQSSCSADGTKLKCDNVKLDVGIK